jgi:hypothetical protein
MDWPEASLSPRDLRPTPFRTTYVVRDQTEVDAFVRLNQNHPVGACREDCFEPEFGFC